MVKKDIDAVKNLLKENEDVSFTQSEISNETGVPVWDVIDILEKFEKRGLVVTA